MRFATRRCGWASMPWASRRPTWRPKRATSACSGWANFWTPAGRATWAGSASAPSSAPIRKRLWREAKTVVSLAINYAPPSDPLEILKHDERAAISVYAQGRDYHEVMKSKLKALGRFIWDTYRHDLKVFVDTAPLDGEARRAGRRPRLAGQAHQPRVAPVRLLAVPGRDPAVGRAAGRLSPRPTIAANAAPASTSARPTPSPRPIVSRRGAASPISPSSMKGPIDRELRPLLGNRIYGCDDCLAVCPWNKFAKAGARDGADAAAGARRASARRAGRARRCRLPQALRRHRRSSASAATASCATSPMRWATATRLPRPGLPSSICWPTPRRWCVARRYGRYRAWHPNKSRSASAQPVKTIPTSAPSGGMRCRRQRTSDEANSDVRAE